MRRVATRPTDAHVTHLLVETCSVSLRWVFPAITAAGRVLGVSKMLLLKSLALGSCTLKKTTLLIVMRCSSVLLLLRHLRVARGRLLWRLLDSVSARTETRIGRTTRLRIVVLLRWRVVRILTRVMRTRDSWCRLHRVTVRTRVARMLCKF